MQVDWWTEKVVFKCLRERDILFNVCFIFLFFCKLKLWLLCWPGGAVQDAESPGKVTCDSTRSLHIYSQVLQDPFQVSEEYSNNVMMCCRSRSCLIVHRCNLDTFLFSLQLVCIHKGKSQAKIVDKVYGILFDYWSEKWKKTTKKTLKKYTAGYLMEHKQVIFCTSLSGVHFSKC